MLAFRSLKTNRFSDILSELGSLRFVYSCWLSLNYCCTLSQELYCCVMFRFSPCTREELPQLGGQAPYRSCSVLGDQRVADLSFLKWFSVKTKAGMELTLR